MPNSYLTQAAECLHDADTLLNLLEGGSRLNGNIYRLYYADELLLKARGLLTRTDQLNPEEDTSELWKAQRRLRTRWREIERKRSCAR